MYTNKKTISNSPYEEALSELRAAVPSLQAIADRAFALAVANEFEGPRRNIERVGIRTVDLIAAIFRACAMMIGRARPLQGCDHLETHCERACLGSSPQTDPFGCGYFHFHLIYEINRHIFATKCH